MIIYAKQNGAQMATFAATGTRADIDDLRKTMAALGTRLLGTRGIICAEEARLKTMIALESRLLMSGLIGRFRFGRQIAFCEYTWAVITEAIKYFPPNKIFLATNEFTSIYLSYVSKLPENLMLLHSVVIFL